MLTSPDIERRLMNACVELPSTLLVDMSTVTFLSSHGIGALIRVQQACDALGVTLRLTTLTRPVQRVLDVTGVLPRFIVDNR